MTFRRLLNAQEIKNTLTIQELQILSEINNIGTSDDFMYFFCGSITKGTKNIFSDIDIVFSCNSFDVDLIENWAKSKSIEQNSFSFTVKTDESLKSFDSEVHIWSKLATGVSINQQKMDDLKKKLIASIQSKEKHEIATRLRADLRNFKRNFDCEYSTLATISWLIIHAAPLLKFFPFENQKNAEQKSIEELLSLCYELEFRDKVWMSCQRHVNMEKVTARPYCEQYAFDLAKIIWQKLPIHGDYKFGL